MFTDTATLDPGVAYRVDTFFRNRYRGCQLSGQYLFSRNDSIHINSFGPAAARNGDAIRNTDVFQIASVSKFITALVITRLMDMDKLRPEDSVQTYLPGFPYQGITIHHLLTHTSGIPEYMYLTDTAWAEDSLIRTNKDATDLLMDRPIDPYYLPGKRFDYCNSNYMLLAHIAERIAQAPFKELVRKYIKAPIGLDSLHVYDPNSRRIDEYPVRGMRGNHTFIPEHPLNHISGDKGIFINVWELFQIYKAFDANRLVSFQGKKRMLRPYVRAKNNQYYGYGIRSTVLDNGEAWNFHNGWWRGYRSYFWFNIEKNECFIVLTNRLKCGFLNTRDLILLLQSHD